MNRKRKVFRKYRDRNHPACKAAARKAAIDVRDAKLSFETKLADNIKYDSKSFFAYVRSKSRARIRAGSLLSESGVLIESSKEKADEFNRYFSSVFSRENLGDVPLCDGRSRGIENGLEQIVITEERVRKVLRSLRGDKSPGVDGIGPRLLVHIYRMRYACLSVYSLISLCRRGRYLRIGEERTLFLFSRQEAGISLRILGRLV